MTSTQPAVVSCSFCGKSRTQVEKLIINGPAGICSECIELCTHILDKERFASLPAVDTNLDPVKIKMYLDQYVIGQEEAKITLSVGIVNHYKRIRLKPDIEVEKSNILLFGPTGSGKTLLAKTIAKYLDVPFIIADATTLTEAGYVGEDVDAVISGLFAAANFDKHKCEEGIIFLDEVDKISRKSEGPSLTRDVSGEGVQQALLKLIEGVKCNVSATGGKKHPALSQIEIDTSKILFIAGGAFTELDRILANRQQAHGIGFGVSVEQAVPNRADIQPEDFIKFGMIPEFTGRFPIVIHTNELTKKDLVRVMNEPRNSLIKQMQFYFESDNVALRFSPGSVDMIADLVIDMKIGARGLKTIMEKILQPFMYNLGQIKKEVTELVITEEDVIRDYGSLLERIAKNR